MYTKKMPQINSLRQLATDIENFPISGLGIVEFAEHQGYSDEIVDFLKLFSRRIIFISQSDFLQHCSMLERLLREEQHSVPEHLRIPQED